jgi:hypothetical protein
MAAPAEPIAEMSAACIGAVCLALFPTLGRRYRELTVANLRDSYQIDPDLSIANLSLFRLPCG